MLHEAAYEVYVCPNFGLLLSLPPVDVRTEIDTMEPEEADAPRFVLLTTALIAIASSIDVFEGIHRKFGTGR